MSTEIELINQIRERIMDESVNDPDAFDDCDLKRVQDDSYVKRFLDERYGKIDDATKMLSECLRWRRSFGVNTMTSDDFPKEIFQVGELHEFAKDKNNITTLYLRVDRHRILPGWKNLIKRYIVYMIERAERQAARNGHGIGLIVDARGGKIHHVEIDLDFFAVKAILNYYPGSLQYLAVYEVPWILMAILKLVKSWFPAQYQDKFRFINRDNLDDIIGLDNVPEYMDGRRPMLWPEEVIKSPSAADLEARGDLPEGATEKVQKIYGYALKEFNDLDEKHIFRTDNPDEPIIQYKNKPNQFHVVNTESNGKSNTEILVIN